MLQVLRNRRAPAGGGSAETAKDFAQSVVHEVDSLLREARTRLEGAVSSADVETFLIRIVSTGQAVEAGFPIALEDHDQEHLEWMLHPFVRAIASPTALAGIVTNAEAKDARTLYAALCAELGKALDLVRVRFWARKAAEPAKTGWRDLLDIMRLTRGH